MMLDIEPQLYAVTAVLIILICMKLSNWSLTCLLENVKVSTSAQPWCQFDQVRVTLAVNTFKEWHLWKLVLHLILLNYHHIKL